MLPVLPPRWFSHSPQQLKFHVMVVNCADPAGSWPAGTRSSLPQHNKVLAVKIWCFPVNVELRYHGLPCEHGLTCWPPSRKPWAAAIQTLLFTILTRTISSRDLLFFFVPIHTHTAHSTHTWQMKVILWTDLLHLLASIHHKHALNLRTNGDIQAIYTTAAHSCTSQRKFTYIFTKSKSHKYTPFHYTTPLSVSALSDK